jgi:hypothetical protein
VLACQVVASAFVGAQFIVALTVAVLFLVAMCALTVGLTLFLCELFLAVHFGRTALIRTAS